MNLPTAMNIRTPGHLLIRNRQNDFQNLVAAEVTRLKHPRDQSLLTSAATEFDALPPSAFAFTRAELLVILAVLSLLAVIVLPALAHDRARSARIQCANNLRQIGVAMQMWGNDHNDQVPWNVSVTEGGTRAHPLAANVWLHFSWLSNELALAKILSCPSDSSSVAIDFTGDAAVGYVHSNFRNRSTSYFLLHGPRNVTAAESELILAGDRNVGSDSGANCPIFNAALVASIGSQPSNFQWNTDLHAQMGNILRGDGHVEQLSNAELYSAGRKLSFMDNANLHFVTPR